MANELLEDETQGNIFWCLNITDLFFPLQLIVTSALNILKPITFI